VQVDESISNETWLIKIADKKTCANLQTCFDFTIVLPSKCAGNNRQRMNRQVLPVKQFHVGLVMCNCEDTRQAPARLALHIAVNSPDSNCFARSLPVSCPVNRCVNRYPRNVPNRQEKLAELADLHRNYVGGVKG
jgi:hypothetical protein